MRALSVIFWGILQLALWQFAQKKKMVIAMASPLIPLRRFP
jgi:hypothetical protein